MSNYTSSNLKMLDQQHQQSLNNFTDAEPVGGDIPASINIPVGRENTRELTVAPSEYRSIHQQRLDSLEEVSGVFCLGNDNPDELPEIASRLNEDDTLVYAEVDPDRFEEVIGSINLIRLATQCDLEIIFDQSLPDLLLKSMFALGGRAEEAGQLRSLLSPGLFLELLDDGSEAASWIKTVVQNQHHNQPANHTSVPGEMDSAEPYEKLLRLFDASIVNAAGTKTLFEEAVQPHQIDSPEPLSIVVEGTTDWAETKQCLDSVYRSNIPGDTEMILASQGELDLSPEAFNYLRDQSHSPSIKTFDPDSNVGLRQAVARESNAETLVFLHSSCTVREENWLDKLLNPLKIHPRVGMSGTVNNIRTGREPADELQHTWLPGLPMPINYTGPNCFAVRTDALEEAGGLKQDPYETTDWRHLDLQWSLRDAGWMVTAPGEAPLIETPETDVNLVSNGIAEKTDEYRRFEKEWGAIERIANTARGNESSIDHSAQPADETAHPPAKSRRTA